MSTSDESRRPVRIHRAHRPSTRRLIAVTVLSAGIAALLVKIFGIDPTHGVVLVAGVATLSICNHILDFLAVPWLEAKDPKTWPRGNAQLRELAFALSSRRSVIGLRSYRRLAQTADERLRLWQQENPGRTAPAPRTLRALADPERGGALRHAEFLLCLSELEHLSSTHDNSHQESGTAP